MFLYLVITAGLVASVWYILGWFFSMDWFDELHRADPNDRFDDNPGIVIGLMMTLYIVLGVLEVITLFTKGIDHKYNSFYALCSGAVLTLILAAFVYDIRERIRTKRGK